MSCYFILQLPGSRISKMTKLLSKQLVGYPLLQMRSAAESLEFRTQLKDAFDFGFRGDQSCIWTPGHPVLMTRPSSVFGSASVVEGQVRLLSCAVASTRSGVV